MHCVHWYSEKRNVFSDRPKTAAVCDGSHKFLGSEFQKNDGYKCVKDEHTSDVREPCVCPKQISSQCNDNLTLFLQLSLEFTVVSLKLCNCTSVERCRMSRLNNQLRTLRRWGRVSCIS